MQYYFIADPHWFHYRICIYCKRPFSSLEDMHTTMIRNWNERVKPEDTVFCIGDWGFKKSSEAYDAPKKCFESIKEQLNGSVILIKGNHEASNDIKTIIHNMVIAIGGHKIFLVHDPKNANPNYTLNFVGHVHQNWKFKKLTDTSTMINVGVDVWNFRPITINEILSEYTNWKKSC